MTYTCMIETPLGEMRAAAGIQGLQGLWFAGQMYFPKDITGWIENKDFQGFIPVRDYLAQYFAGKNPKLSIPLQPNGTVFQKKVWGLLRTVPYGETSTYGALAEQLQTKGAGTMLSRAVGSAVAHNPISIIIPCHRIIGAKGDLVGYAGGLPRKEKLLILERSSLTAS